MNIVSRHVEHVLTSYVERHNSGVRSRDFTAMLELFAADAVVIFHDIAIGPFRGDEIAAAFRRSPPDDEIVLIGNAAVGDSQIESDYAWSRSRQRRGGRLRISSLNGAIAKLEIWAK